MANKVRQPLSLPVSFKPCALSFYWCEFLNYFFLMIFGAPPIAVASWVHTSKRATALTGLTNWREWKCFFLFFFFCFFIPSVVLSWLKRQTAFKCRFPTVSNMACQVVKVKSSLLDTKSKSSQVFVKEVLKMATRVRLGSSHRTTRPTSLHESAFR